MKRVTGIGGIFFKSESPGSSANRTAREHRFTGANRRQQTAPSPVPEPDCVVHLPTDHEIFGASKASFMVNYRVDNLDALLEDLKKSGIEIDPHREDYDYGRFAWITDPDGNRIELWDPPKPKEDGPQRQRPR